MADNKIQVLLEVDDKGTASLQRFGQAAEKVGRDGSRSLLSMGTAATSLASGLAALAGGVSLVQLGKSAFDAGLQMDSLNRAMTAIYGSSKAAAAEMEFLQATADRTGQNVYNLVESFNQFSASTKDTALEGENTRKVFSAMSEAASVLGMSNERAGRAFTALSQMASKGTISMEELRGQLGEALPGALNLFAKGMGVSTGELIELISKGKVGSEAMVQFADAVHQAYGEASEISGLQSAQAAVNKLSEEWFEFKVNLADMGTAIAAIHAVTEALKILNSILLSWDTGDAFAKLGAGFASLGDYAETSVNELAVTMGTADAAVVKITTDLDAARQRLAEYRAEGDALAGSPAMQGAAADVARLETALSAATKSKQAATSAAKPLAAATKNVADTANAAAKAATTTSKAKDTLAKSSNTAAKAAKDLAAEQKRLAEEAERTGRAQIDAAVKTREATAMLDKALFDTGEAYDTLGITSRKSYEDQVKAATDAYERILSIEDLTDSERARLREGLQKTLIELEDNYRGKVEETTGAIAVAWEDLTEDTKQVLHDWVESAVKMEFDSIGEAFEGLAESILNVWIDLLAKMIAEWAISGITSLFSGGSLLGGISSGLGGLLDDIPVVGGLFKSGDKMMDWGLNALGGSALAAGGASLLGGGGGAGIGAALGGGVSAGAAALFPSVFDAGAAATSFGAGAAEAFGSALIGGPTAGGLEWASIPGKEFFGTGASQTAAAGGAGIGTAAAFGGMAAFAGGLYALASMTATPWQSITSPTMGIGVDMPIHGSYGESDARRRASTLLDIESGLYDPTAGGGGDTIGMSSLAEFDLKPIIEDAKGLLDILANQWGDGLAKLALDLDGSVAATDRMIDAAAGYDVRLQTSAELNRLAAEAVGGSSTAMESLRATLQSLGLSEEQTETAMLGLIAATGNTTGKVQTLAAVLQSQGMSAADAQSTAQTLVAAMQSQSTAASSAAGAISGMVSNINTLSNTPLNIRVGVETYRIDNSNPYAEHASGGIFSSPTLIPSIRGTRHLVGEAGAEAIMPLHAGPKTLEKMHEDIRALAARPMTTIINLDGRQIASATMPFVDAHVAAKATRGQLGRRTVY